MTTAITGGIGSGKSTVANMIAEYGFPVFSCDEIYKEIIYDKNYIREIEKVFPNAVQNGQIDRGILAKTVFSNEQALKTLNSISHPLIMNELMSRMKKVDDMFAFAEVPLLFEGGFEDLFDNVIIVMRDKEKRIQALKKRNNFSDEEIERRFNNQIDYSLLKGNKNEKYLFIENNSTVEELRPYLTSILMTIQDP